MEERLKERLIEAAKLASSSPGMRLSILPGGILTSYTWEGKSGQYKSTDCFTSWQAIENAINNPLPQGMVSLSKQAAGLQ